MRDVLVIPFNQVESLVIASDNSGGIGLKKDDHIQVAYEEVAYYSLRVSMMECLAAGATPLSIILQNFNGDLAWKPLVAGIEKGLQELGMYELSLTGSTESNFQLKQSATAVTVIGKISNHTNIHTIEYNREVQLAVIGKPLVGEAVLTDAADIAPLTLCAQLAAMNDVLVMPVGSKGIFAELNQFVHNHSFAQADLKCELDLLGSSGPSTCFIISYTREVAERVKEICGSYFHPIHVSASC